MRKFFKNLKEKVTGLATRAAVAIENKKAEGYVDSGVKILIAVVIGALLLAGLYLLFNNTIMPTVGSVKRMWESAEVMALVKRSGPS